MTAAEVLQPAIIYLGAGLSAALASRAARLSPIVGYLVAGVIIGPSGFGLVSNNDTSRFLAELGVVFLMFSIGLHFSLREIRGRRDDMIGLAPLQIILCGLVFAGIGWGLGFPIPVAAIVGLSLALSSTVVVVRILEDRRQPGCPMGRSATAVLVAQDIVAIFILALAASLGANPNVVGLDLLAALGMAIVALGVALLAGRFVVRPLFRSLAATDNQEAFTVVALFIVLAASAATDRIGLSLMLGAFLAGMAISDTPYRHVVQSEVKPFAGLLLGLFFMSVGMGVNLPAIAAIWPAVLLTALVIAILKTVIVFAAARLNGWALPGATQLGFLLSQGSEFTLVIVGVSTIAGAMPGAWAGVITAAVAVTLVAAPVWAQLGLHIARLLAERSKTAPLDLAEVAEENPVLIFGMTPEGRLAADALRDLDIPYMAVDSDPERFVLAASDGYTVVYGDARDRRLVDSLGAAKARAILLGASNPESITAFATAANQDDGAPPLRFAAVSTTAERAELERLGFRTHLSATEPRGIDMATDLLRELGVDKPVIARWLTDLAERRGLIDRTGAAPEAKSEAA